MSLPADRLVPETAAILREHEEITNHFVPRAFIERIRAWGKKFVVVLNKADLLATEQDLTD